MPVAFNAVTEGSGSSATPTLSHNPAGTNRALLVVLAWIHELGDATFEGITFAALPLVELGAAQIAGGVALQTFKLNAPPAGAANVVATFDMPVEYALTAVSYTGAHQSSPTGVVAVASGTSAEASVLAADTLADTVVLDACAVAALTATIAATPHGGQVQRVSRNAGVSPLKFWLGVSDDVGGGNVDMAWSLSHSRAWVHKAIEVKPAPVSGAYRWNWVRRLGSRAFGGG